MSRTQEKAANRSGYTRLWLFVNKWLKKTVFREKAHYAGEPEGGSLASPAARPEDTDSSFDAHSDLVSRLLCVSAIVVTPLVVLGGPD